MRSFWMAAALALCAVSAAAAPAPANDARIEQISAQLYLEATGEWSRDVMAEPRFIIFNSIIGDGDAKGQPANDLLVTVSMAVPNPDADLDGTLVLTVKDGKDHVLARRTVVRPLAIGGHMHKAVFLRDVGCAGDLTIEARYGTQKKTATVSMSCGE